MEYKTKVLKDSLNPEKVQALLNEITSEGWDLVSVLQSGRYWIFICKRPQAKAAVGLGAPRK